MAAMVAPPAGVQVRASAEAELPRGTTMLGMLLVVMADAMVLAGLMAAWYVIKGQTLSWPPKGVQIDTYMATVVTITSAMSSFSAAWAVSAAKRNDQRSAGVAVILTVVLGLAMVNALWYNLTHLEFGVATHAFGTLYHLLIGYVLVHVALAVVAFFVAGARAVAGQLGARNHDPMRAAGALWHYTTAAWSVIVVSVFVFSPHG